MTHGTKQKIMDAALNEFSLKGYYGARTQDIALKSGLSEMTVFRRYNTKKNLFDRVLMENYNLMIAELNSIFAEENNDGPEDFFKSKIMETWDVFIKYFDFLTLIALERCTISENIVGDVVSYFTKIFEKIFPDANIDSKVFVYGILTFMYFSILDKTLGRKVIGHKEDFEKYVDYMMLSLDR